MVEKSNQRYNLAVSYERCKVWSNIDTLSIPHRIDSFYERKGSTLHYVFLHESGQNCADKMFEQRYSNT